MIIIHQGDALAVLKTLPEESVHCCVTSPPYWGLRDYGVAGQGGLEPTLGEHLAGLVEVFREVRRVLRKDGTCWVNYGDAYASSPNGRSAADTKALGNDDRTFRDKPISTVGPILFQRIGAGGTMKPKDRMLLPARVAIALHDDGWYVRDEIIWHKPNPMPSSVKDRTTPAHEMIYMLSKRQKYFYDSAVIREDCVKTGTPGHLAGGRGERAGIRGGLRGKAYLTPKQDLLEKRQYSGFNERWDAQADAPLTRNKRSVWTIAPAPFAEAHFATFPPKLIEPCILAGCPPGGTVLDPFFGAGTTGLVAQQHGRDCIGIELNPAYIEIAKRRLGLSSTATEIFA